MFYDLLVKHGVDRQTAIEDACSMEHAVSTESFAALSDYFKTRMAERT